MSDSELNRQYRLQRTALTRATRRPEGERKAAVIAACRKAVAEWSTWRAWPDEWSRWQRALDDAFKWPERAPRLEDLDDLPRSNPSHTSAYAGGYQQPEHVNVQDLQVGDLVLHNPSLPKSGYAFKAKGSSGADWWEIQSIQGTTKSRGEDSITFLLCKLGGSRVVEDRVPTSGVAYARRPVARNNPSQFSRNLKKRAPLCARHYSDAIYLVHGPSHYRQAEKGEACVKCEKAANIKEWDYEKRGDERSQADSNRRSNPDDPISLFKKNWNKGGGYLTVFSGGTPGVPTLTDMREMADAFGATVDHAGYGVFIAKVRGASAFGFLAGGAMTREGDYSYSNISPEQGYHAKVVAWIRKRYPGLVGPVSSSMSSYWKRPNPSKGMPGMPYAWVAKDGSEVEAGDLVEFHYNEGPHHDPRWVRKKAKVLRYLIFDDHVQVALGHFGTTVDDSNFIRVVRKAH